MSTPVPDLAALREKAEQIRAACPCCNPFGDEDGNDAAADQILAVLALIDRLQAENERLRKAHRNLASCFAMVAQHDVFHNPDWLAAVVTEAQAISVPPAEKEQPA